MLSIEIPVVEFWSCVVRIRSKSELTLIYPIASQSQSHSQIHSSFILLQSYSSIFIAHSYIEAQISTSEPNQIQVAFSFLFNSLFFDCSWCESFISCASMVMILHQLATAVPWYDFVLNNRYGASARRSVC